MAFTGNSLFFLILVKTFTGGMDVFPPPFFPSYSKSLCEPLNFAPPVLMASNTSGGTRLLLSESVD